MESSISDWQIVERKLRRTPYIACLAGFAAVALGVWFPFSVGILVVAAGTGVVSFAFGWWRMHSRRDILIFDPGLQYTFGLPLVILVSAKNGGFAAAALVAAQCMAVCTFTWTGLFALFRRQLVRTLKRYEILSLTGADRSPLSLWERRLSFAIFGESDFQYARFANVQMPRWYRISARVVRAMGFLIFLASAWQMTREGSSVSVWLMGALVGVLVLALPSLPKAYIEQRNRLRGLRDGSFKEFLESERQKDR